MSHELAIYDGTGLTLGSREFRRDFDTIDKLRLGYDKVQRNWSGGASGKSHRKVNHPTSVVVHCISPFETDTHDDSRARAAWQINCPGAAEIASAIRVIGSEQTCHIRAISSDNSVIPFQAR